MTPVARLRRSSVVRLICVAVPLVVLAAACGDSGGDELVLDGRPRFPDAEGIAVSITRRAIVLDGNRRFPVGEGFKSFSTYTLALEPMLGREGEYVQLGVADGRAVWMASIGGLHHTDPPKVLYEGRVQTVRKRQAIFRDGTVLRMARGVQAPDVSSTVLAELDPDAHVVRSFSRRTGSATGRTGRPG